MVDDFDPLAGRNRGNRQRKLTKFSSELLQYKSCRTFNVRQLYFIVFCGFEYVS